MLGSKFRIRGISGSVASRIAIFGILILVGTAEGNAQGIPGFGPTGSGTYPSQAYYDAVALYRSGDLPTANKAFEFALGRTRVDINGRWIDAIPVHAMLAECQWHLGDVAAAREHLDAVYLLAVRHRGWFHRVEWASVLNAGAVRARPTGLWAEAAAVNSLPISQRMPYQDGQRLTEARLAQGGTIEEPLNTKVIDVVEIMRGIAIASYRRRVILASLAQQDPLTREALDATKYPAGMQVAVARALIGSVRGAELFANHDDEQTVANAVKYSMANGGVHPISPLSLLCQASAVAGSKRPTDAVALAGRAVNVAGALEQYEYVGEAMQLAAGCANPQQASGVRASAQKAIPFLSRRSRMATLHCLIAGADAAVTAGELEPAAVMLQQARTLGARRDVVQPRMSAYASYVSARLAAAGGQAVGVAAATEVDNSIHQMKEFALNRKNRSRPVISMPRIYQLELIRRAMGKQLGGQSSEKLLQNYCHEPPEVLWRRDPVDALSSVIVDRTVPHVARLQIAAASKRGIEVLARTDELLAHRFRRRLTLGGRVTQVRALARTDDRLLDKDVIAFRANAPKPLKDLRAEVGKAIGDKAELQARANRLESQATQIALSRIAFPNVMLPPLKASTALAQLPEKTGLLTFVNVENRLYVTLAAEGKVEFWTVGGVARIPAEITRVLRGIGVGSVRGNRLPEDEAWRKDAVTLRRHLLPDDALVSVERFDRLVIVPDSSLWYLPFEMLPLEGENSPLIGDKIKVRYAATPGLAFRPTAPRSRVRAVGIADDKFFAPRDPDRNESIVQQLADSVDDAIRIPSELNVPSSLISNSVGHLLVAAPVSAKTGSPFAMSIATYDRNNAAGTLAAWMRFPAKMPESVVMPGHRTAADTAQLGNGEEIFLTICGLQSAGVRDVLLSRWIVGGESTSIALGEFLQELPFSGMHASWDRARALLRRSELDPMAEPLLTKAEHELEGLTGNKPFFWASYLVAAPFSDQDLNKSAKVPTP